MKQGTSFDKLRLLRVNDLVELIRQIDQGLLECRMKDEQCNNVLNQTHNQGLYPVNQETLHGQDNKKTAGEMVATPIKDRESISDFFTYFDCTEYKDLTDYPQTHMKEHYVMSLDKQISPLTFWEYLQLGWAYLAYSTGKPFDRNGRDVHGRYFWGQFSQQLMYRLAFVGFQEFLDSLSPEQTATDTLCCNSPSLSPDQAKRQMALDELSRIMERLKTIQQPEKVIEVHYLDRI